MLLGGGGKLKGRDSSNFSRLLWKLVQAGPTGTRDWKRTQTQIIPVNIKQWKLDSYPLSTVPPASDAFLFGEKTAFDIKDVCS